MWVLLFLLLTLSYRSLGFTEDPQQDSNIVVFNVKMAAKQRHLKEMGVHPPFWTPQEDQIADLERRILPYLKRDPWYSALQLNFLTYGRQYFGVYRGKRKLIYLNAFCNPEEYPNGKWKMEKRISMGDRRVDLLLPGLL